MVSCRNLAAKFRSVIPYPAYRELAILYRKLIFTDINNHFGLELVTNDGTKMLGMKSTQEMCDEGDPEVPLVQIVVVIGFCMRSCRTTNQLYTRHA